MHMCINYIFLFLIFCNSDRFFIRCLIFITILNSFAILMIFSLNNRQIEPQLNTISLWPICLYFYKFFIQILFLFSVLFNSFTLVCFPIKCSFCTSYAWGNIIFIKKRFFVFVCLFVAVVCLSGESQINLFNFMSDLISVLPFTYLFIYLYVSKHMYFIRVCHCCENLA